MEKAARAAVGAHRFGRYVFFLYDQTGEEQYRTWIERNAEWLKNSPQSENGVFGCVEDSSRNISGSVMFAVYPFYMEYETRYHNKAEYAQIVRQLLTLAPSEQTDMEQTGWYLMTVIDVIDNVSGSAGRCGRRDDPPVFLAGQLALPFNRGLDGFLRCGEKPDRRAFLQPAGRFALSTFRRDLFYVYGT